jgi:hypothetical protein
LNCTVHFIMHLLEGKQAFKSQGMLCLVLLMAGARWQSSGTLKLFAARFGPRSPIANTQTQKVLAQPLSSCVSGGVDISRPLRMNRYRKL